MNKGMIALIAVGLLAWINRERLAEVTAQAAPGAGLIREPWWTQPELTMTEKVYVPPVSGTDILEEGGLPGFYLPVEGGQVPKFAAPGEWATKEYAAEYAWKILEEPHDAMALQAYAIEYQKAWGEPLPGYVFQRDPPPSQTGLYVPNPLREGYILGSPEALRQEPSRIDEDIEKMASMYVKESSSGSTSGSTSTSTSTSSTSDRISRIAASQPPRIGE